MVVIVIHVTVVETEDGIYHRGRGSHHPLHLVGNGRVVGEIVAEPGMQEGMKGIEQKGLRYRRFCHGLSVNYRIPRHSMVCAHRQVLWIVSDANMYPIQGRYSEPTT